MEAEYYQMLFTSKYETCEKASLIHFKSIINREIDFFYNTKSTAHYVLITLPSWSKIFKFRNGQYHYQNSINFEARKYIYLSNYMRDEQH